MSSKSTMAAEKQKKGDLRFGWGCWKPNCLQFLNTANGFLIWMLLANTFVSFVTSGVGSVAISSIEVRFKLNSNQTGWIASAYEVAGLPMYILIILYGNRVHRPFSAGLGILCVAFGSLLFTIPHFSTSIYVPEGHGVSDDFRCLADDNLTSVNRTCSEDIPETSPLSEYFVVFILARLFQGIGVVPLFTLTVTFLDDCLTKETFSFCLSLFITFGLIGSSLGYALGGYLLSIFTDFLSLGSDEIGISSDDPRWVGCWWIGFVVAGIPLLLIAVPFLGYPSDLPGAADVRAKKITEAHKATHNDVEDDVITMTCSGLMTSCRQLACNPVYVFITLFVCTDMFIVTAFGNFGPKYVETQFSVTAGFAGMIFGGMTIPGGVLGTVTGGWLIKRYRLTTAQILRACIVLTSLLVTTGGMFFIICEPVSFAGVTQPYHNDSVTNLTSGCNAACACDGVPFTPVCGVDNVQYYSPCHAGCAEINDEKVYSNCTCIPGPLPSTRLQPCTVASCTLMPLFMGLFFVSMFITTMVGAMTGTVTLRCVPRQDRSAALGIQGTVARLLGSIPAPIAFGAAFDWSCKLWQETCGQRGTCLSYNNTHMSVYIFLFSMGIKIVSILFVVVCWWLYKPPTFEEKALEVDMGGGEEERSNDKFEGAEGYDNRGLILTTRL